MSPLPTNSHSISLQQAIEMTKRYRDQRSKVTTQAFQNSLLTCETFNRAAFDGLLSTPGCAGVRIYFAMDEKFVIKLVAVPVNANDEDILPSDADALTAGAGDTPPPVEQGQTCPPICPPPGHLGGG